MRIPMTRSKSIEVWFAAMAFMIVAAIVFGAAVTVSTGAMFVAMWPGDQPLAASPAIPGTDRRSCGRGHEGGDTPIRQQRNGRRSA
jgi:hypothetical protein